MPEWSQWRGREGTFGGIKEPKQGEPILAQMFSLLWEKSIMLQMFLIWVPNSSLCGAWLVRKWSLPVFSPVQIISDGHMHRQEEKKESTLVVQATEMQSGKALLRLCGRNSSKSLPKRQIIWVKFLYQKLLLCQLLYLLCASAQGIIYKRESSSIVAA